MPAAEADGADDLALLIEAVRAAAPLAMARFRPGRKTSAEAWAKAQDQSLVTEADLAVNDALREILRAARPGYGWLSEEDADAPERLERERVFIVDPIDGTRSFAQGEPEFCLSVAVAEGGRAIAAAIFAPALDDLYAADAAGPALKNDAPISASGLGDLDAARVLAVKSHLTPQKWPGGPPPITRGYVHPIAYRLCLVAEGAWDGLISLRGTNEWDVAAGDLIARQAGAAVSDARGAAFSYNKRAPRVPSVLAAGDPLHSQFLARLRPDETP